MYLSGSHIDSAPGANQADFSASLRSRTEGATRRHRPAPSPRWSSPVVPALISRDIDMPRASELDRKLEKLKTSKAFTCTFV